MTNRKKPLVIAIIFGDNDFHDVFTNLLGVIERVSENYENVDKSTLLKIINLLAYPMYRASQNTFEYNNEIENYDEHMKEYLLIEEHQLLLGPEEADRYTSVTTWNNSETFILDTRLPEDQQIYSL